MELYRKPDQYYNDEYDRLTIKMLKELEKERKPPIKQNFGNLEILHEDVFSSFYTTGVFRAQNKKSSISDRIKADEKKDFLIKNSILPKNILCRTCSASMHFCMYMFDLGDTRISFAFECLNGDKLKRIIYADGSERIFKKSTCPSCGYELLSSTKKMKNKYIFTDTCTGCGIVTIDELEIPPESKPMQISDEDRQKYCLYFNGKSTFFDDLQKVVDLCEYIKERDQETSVKNEAGFEKVERLTMPQVEQRLLKAIEGKLYTHFYFEKPKSGRYFIVEFSLQDVSERNAEESVKILTKAFKKALFPTNWRLMLPGITYRLGYLSGSIKGYDDDEGLIKIAREIKLKENN